ncbi:MAG: putative molybdenum carrier protein [Planctomycetota bacterium]
MIPWRYPLRETKSAEYEVRTERNVLEADATLIVSTYNAADPGTSFTSFIAWENGRRLDFAFIGTGPNAPDGRQLLSRPFRPEPESLPAIASGPTCWSSRNWNFERKYVFERLSKRRVRTLNVAGPRGSSVPGIYAAAKEFLLPFFQMWLDREPLVFTSPRRPTGPPDHDPLALPRQRRGASEGRRKKAEG